MVRGISFSPDGRYLLSASKDQTVRVWDVRQRAAVRVFEGHTDWVWQAVVLKDGKRALSCGSDGVVLWRLETGEILGRSSGHRRHVRGMGLSPGQESLLVFVMDGSLEVWDVETFARRAVRPVKDQVGFRVWMEVCFSPDGAQVATNGNTGVLLWNGDASRLEGVLAGPHTRAGHYAYAPDGRLLAVGYEDGKVRLWNRETREIVRTMEGHDGYVHGLAFTSDGRFLISGSYDRTVRVWELRSGKRVKTLEAGYPVLQVAASPDGRYIAASCDGTSSSGTPSESNPVVLWELLR